MIGSAKLVGSSVAEGSEASAASSAKNGATNSNDPSVEKLEKGVGGPSSWQAVTRFSIIPRTDDANARGELLCRYSCTRRAKGPARRGRRLRRTAREQPESILHHLALLMPVPITLHAPASVVAPLPSHPERRACAVPVDLGSLE